MNQTTMIANYHTHTWRCNHAQEGEENYVRHAIQRGLKILGFSDHTPYPFPGSYDSGFRMCPELLPDYCQCITGLQKKYAGKIKIEIGLEAEYYPRLFSKLLGLIQDTPISYLILGQHFTDNETDGVYSGTPTENPSVLKRYCAQTMDAMQTGCFTYFAHPDLIRFIGSDRIYRQEMGRLFREARNCGIPLEINFLGLSTRRHYPSRRFLEIAAEEGCDMVFGCDAHQADSLSDLDAEEKALALTREYGLNVLKTVPLRPIR